MTASRRRWRILLAIALIGLTIALTPATSVAKKPAAASGMSGTVWGPDSDPVAAAVVTAYALPGAIAGCEETDDVWRAVATTTTSSAGSYALSLAPGYYRLGVAPPASASASFGYRVDTYGSDDESNVTSWVGFAEDIVVPTGAARTNINVRLSSPRSITGTVTEQGTGDPLAGIEVRAVAATNSQLQRLAPMTTTGPTGAFTIAGLPNVVPDPVPATQDNEAARYGLTYLDPTGWHQLWLWWFSDITPGPNDTPVVDLKADPQPVRSAALTPTARYTGVVRDARGHRLAGIAVEPFSDFPYPPRFTDSKGRYVVEAGLTNGWILRFSDPAGRYRTTFSGGYEFPSQAIAADPTLVQPNTPGVEKVSDVTLLNGSRVTGMVVYSAEVPAAGASVQVWRTGYDANDWYNTTLGGSVACDGTFSIAGIWPGTHNIGFAPPRQYGVTVTRTEMIPAAGGTLALGRVTLPSWIAIGQVNGPDGPLEGIQVNLTGSGEDSRFAHAVTDSNGQFRVFTPYSVFQMDVQVHDPQDRWPDQTQSATDNDPWDSQGPFLQFQMAPPVARGIEGVVHDAGGNPIAGITPHLLYTSNNIDIPGQASNASGYYSVSIFYAGGLPAWVVEYRQNGTTIGYYSDTEPTHLVTDISLASLKYVAEIFTPLEVVTLPASP